MKNASGTESTSEYAGLPHAGRGSMGTSLLSVPAPTISIGLLVTAVHPRFVHGAENTKSVEASWMMLLELKKRCELRSVASTDDRSCVDTSDVLAPPVVHCLFSTPECTPPRLAITTLPNLPPVPSRSRMPADWRPELPLPTIVMP